MAVNTINEAKAEFSSYILSLREGTFEVGMSGTVKVDEQDTKRRRRPQERTELTRNRLIKAGQQLFPERGFDAVSVRDLEATAGVKRNVLAYHFGDKEHLWMASTDAIFGEMRTEFEQRLAIMKEVSAAIFGISK